MKILFLLLLLSPLFSHSQSERSADAANSIQLRSFVTSAGTFTTEDNDPSQRVTAADKMEIIERVAQTSDGGISTYIFNKEAMEFNEETEVLSEINVTISPNPFSNTARVTIEEAELSFENTAFVIYDLYGRIVNRLRVADSIVQIDRGNLSDGIYFYKIIENNIQVTAGKIMLISNK